MATKRLYSLYERDGKRWKRVSDLALTRSSAVHIFQGRLLSRSLGEPGPELQIRPLTTRERAEYAAKWGY